MGDTLKLLRDLTIIVGIYLYFIAWVYIHFYYQQFGISTESVRIDYNSYLVYSYNVLTSSNFLYWVKVVGLVVAIRWLFIYIISRLKNKNDFFKKTSALLSNNFITVFFTTIRQRYALLPLLIFMVAVFPLLFRVARDVAVNNYRQDRMDTRSLKTIQFIFRKDAGPLSPAVVLDSLLPQDNTFYEDIALIKKDEQQVLKLLGESDKYYIVLQQYPYDKSVGALPSGNVYFINKQDILLSKIILRSL